MDLHKNASRTTDTASPTYDNASTFTEALTTLRDLADIPQDESVSETLRSRFEEIQRQCERLAAFAPALQKTHYEVAATNATSAASCDTDVAQAAERLVVNSGRFNILAAKLSLGSVHTVVDLSRAWARYTSSGNSRDAMSAIDRVVRLGILESLEGDRVQRCRNHVEFKGAVKDPKPKHAETLRVEKRSAPERLDFEALYGEIVAHWLRGGSQSAPTNRPYRGDTEDLILLVSLIAQGNGGAEVGSYWRPAIASRDLMSTFKAATGMKIQPFRVRFKHSLHESLIAKVRDVVCAVAVQQPEAPHGATEETLALMCDQLAACSQPTFSDEERSRLAAALQVSPADISSFLTRVLLQSKEGLLQILGEPPFLPHLGERTLRLTRKITLFQTSLNDCGTQENISGERVSQILETIEGIHPLIRSIIRARAEKAELQCQVPNQSEIQELESLINANPAEAYQRGLELDKTGGLLPGENEAYARQRMFQVGFAGRYSPKAGEARSYPSWIKQLQKYPDAYFKALAHTAMNTRIDRAIREFRPALSQDFVSNQLTQAGLGAEDCARVTEYLSQLITQPTTCRRDLWMQLESDENNQRRGETVLSLFKDVIQKKGQERARAACAVFDEPWCAHWLPSSSLMHLLQERIINQKSILETCAALGWTHGHVSVSTTSLYGLFPSLVNTVPRQWRAKPDHHS